MPTITNDTIRALYELYGNDDYPVDRYCIGCGNCEVCGFPCANCAAYVFSGQLGEGTITPIDENDDMPDLELVIDENDDIIDDMPDLELVIEDDDDIIGPSTPMEIDEIPLDLMYRSSDDIESLKNIQEEVDLVRNLISDPLIPRRLSC